MSHSDAQCQHKAEMAKKAIPDSVADQAKQVKRYRKEYKAMHKKLLVIKKKHKKLLTFNRKNSVRSKRSSQKAKGMQALISVILMILTVTSTYFLSVTIQRMRMNERDLMTKLGLIMDYKRKVLTWDEISVPMRSAYHTDSKPTFSRPEITQIMTKRTAEPIATQEATERIVKILDSKYEKADLDKVTADAEQLGKHQQRKLLSLLKDFENLFDGTLGHWETEPIDIELKP